MDGASKYYSVVTDIGNQMMVAALANGTKLSMTEIAVGDGSGAYYQPDPDMTSLKNELWRGPINSCEVSSSADNIMIVKGIIPGEVGGFTIREMAIYAESGEMVAIANTPSTPKVTIVDGIINEMSVAIEIAMLNGAAIELVIDPNIVTATKADIEVLAKRIADNGKVLVGPRDTEIEKNDTLFVTGAEGAPIKRLVRKDKEGNETEYVVGDDDITELETTFAEATIRGNIQSGDKLGIILGKIRKWFSDLKDAAFHGVANNCATTAPGYLLDARQGKALLDLYNQLSSNFTNGCSIIAGKITACGVATASNASPQTMANNIQAIFDNRYANGYNTGWNAGISHISTNNATATVWIIGHSGGGVWGVSWATSDANLIIIARKAEKSGEFTSAVSNAVCILDGGGAIRYQVWKTTARGLYHDINVSTTTTTEVQTVLGVRF